MQGGKYILIKTVGSNLHMTVSRDESLCLPFRTMVHTEVTWWILLSVKFAGQDQLPHLNFHQVPGKRDVFLVLVSGYLF